MSSSKARVCLISMPFVPVNMPGLGVSTLKATLASRGIACDIYYGSLEFFRFYEDVGTMADLRLDYDFIATNMHIGDLFFASALWGDERGTPEDAGVVDLVIDRLTETPNTIFTRDQMREMSGRLRTYAKRLPAFVECCYRARDWGGYDIIGFSSTFAQSISSLALARRIHARHPDPCIVFGGANCDSVMGEQLVRSFPEVDAVIRGEADFAFPEFVQRKLSGSPLGEVPGIVWRQGGEVVVGAEPVPLSDMDTLPYPDFDDYFAQLPPGFERVNGYAPLALPIETSRGCWWGAVKHCIFCGLNPTTMKFRRKTPSRALDEFRDLRTRYGRRRFYAVDNIIDKRYFRDVLPALESEKLQIFYETKSNLAEWEVAQLARAGVSDIQPGIEGLSSEVLALMEKGVKGYQNVELLKWCAIHQVEPIWFYLYGFPNERAEAYLSDIAQMDKLHHLPPPKNANPVLLDRYSPMFFRREKFGLKNVRAAPASRIAYRGLSDDEVWNLSYHFEMELPGGSELPYAGALSAAIMRWRYEYLRGARFYQFAGDASTLLLDTRRGTLSAAILTGAGARIHGALRRGRRLGALVEELASDRSDGFAVSVRDLTLAQVAAWLGAEPIPSPKDVGSIPTFVDALVARDIVLSLDGRFLALAIDCVKESEAAPFGLTDFVVKSGAARAPSPKPDLRLRVVSEGAQAHDA